MTTSELIARLQTSLARDGDLPVAIEAGDGVFLVGGTTMYSDEFEQQTVLVVDLTAWE
jgi:hypothetical protein